MDMAKFTEFSQKCSKKLPNEIDFCSPSDEKWNFAETLLWPNRYFTPPSSRDKMNETYFIGQEEV